MSFPMSHAWLYHIDAAGDLPLPTTDGGFTSSPTANGPLGLEQLMRKPGVLDAVQAALGSVAMQHR